MNPERPFHVRNVRGFSEEVKDQWQRIAVLPDMDRATLIAARDWPDCQPAVKTRIKNRLKQFDEWGYDVTVEYNNGQPSKTITIPGNAKAVRRKAMYKRNVLRVVALGPPITREQWIRAYGDGKTRM